MAHPAPSAPVMAAPPGSPPRVGVLAVQGDIREHVRAISDLGARPVEVRLPRDLAGLSALILPGGESTTMRKLIDRFDLREPLMALAQRGVPLYGTCAGMILLARRIVDGDDPVLPLLDIAVERNGYGRQLDSFEADIAIPSLGSAPLHAIFIRAPVVSAVGPGVDVLARDADGHAVAVRQGQILATAFHPELTADRRLHGLLLEMIPR